MQGDEMTTEGETGIELLTILLGKEDTGTTMQNPRQVPFLNARRPKTRSRAAWSTSPVAARWKASTILGARPFYLKFDDDIDDEIQDPITQGNIVRKKIVIVYSYVPGRQNRWRTGDEVKTW